MDANQQLQELIEALTKAGAVDELDIASSPDDEEQPDTNKPAPKFLNTDLLDPETARKVRMLQVISKFASTLTLRPIYVNTANGRDGAPDAPAWSDAENIWFHDDTIGDLTDPETVLNIKGLSLHEIAHILLTPRTGSNLAKDVQKEGLWRAFNALEDQRIEMMMTKRFGNVADWLSAAVAKFIMEEPDQWSVAYPLLHGRKYLDKGLRDQVRDLYEQQPNVAEIGSLIDRYIVLNLADAKNYAVALEIIKRYNELVMELPEKNPSSYWNPQGGWARVKDPAGHNHRKEGEWKSSKSKPMSKAEQQKVADKVSDAVANDKANDEAGDQQSANPSQGMNNPNGTEAGSGTDDPASTAGAIYEKIKSNKAREIAQIIKQYSAESELTATSGGTPDRMETDSTVVSPAVSQASRSFANELERLRAEFDPGWLRRTESGRLNVQRYVAGETIDECFDEWDIGREDAVDIEAVILLDISGSMQGVAKGAFESMWAMKRALDRTNASTTVIAFDHRAQILYSSDERAGQRMKTAWCRGGTEPKEALKYAKNVLAQSNRAIKVCITITDGVWGQADDCDKILREFRRAGVLTALAFISDPTNMWHDSAEVIDTHGCEVATHIVDTSDLFALGRNIVSLGISRNLVNAGA